MVLPGDDAQCGEDVFVVWLRYNGFVEERLGFVPTARADEDETFFGVGLRVRGCDLSDASEHLEGSLILGPVGIERREAFVGGHQVKPVWRRLRFGESDRLQVVFL